MRLLLLGSPGNPGDPVERWHDDAYEGAIQLGWDVAFLRAKTHTEAEIVAAARGADLLMWMRTHDYNLRGGDGRVMLRRVEDMGVPTVGLHFDLYWGIANRQHKIGVEPWWTSQYVFTADGGVRDWRSRGVNHFWCPPPFGTRYLGYGTRSGPGLKAAFVGSAIMGIHSPHRQQMIGWARRQWGRHFVHVGRTCAERVYGRDLNDLYASTDLVLGDSALAPMYWSDRLPRTLGRGGLLAYPHTPGLDEQGFTDEVMIRFKRGDFSHILRRMYELSPTQRRNMTDAGIELVRSRHLWRHRLEHIAEVVTGAGDSGGRRAAAQVG